MLAPITAIMKTAATANSAHLTPYVVPKTDVYRTERNHRKSVPTPAATPTPTISATTDARTGTTYLDHRGSTMGRPPVGRERPADRKATPPPYLSSGAQ